MADASGVKLEAKPAAAGSSNSVLFLVAGLFIVLIALQASILSTVTDTNETVGEKVVTVDSYRENTLLVGGTNVCKGKKPADGITAGDNYFVNEPCEVANVIKVLEQAGANVTEGYVGGFNTSGRAPQIKQYWQAGMCPVNVHWHLGAEHLSVGQYDETGTGPASTSHRKLLAGAVREGFKCHHYDAKKPMFTTEYTWKHCVGMHVGNTYEVHWPHSAAGACGTPNQYQTPFYDGVFCMPGIISLGAPGTPPLNVMDTVGVHGQVFTIVNDENYYYPDLMRGMVIDGVMGDDVAIYTGSTTGTSRDNTVCSKYTPITWQVDRKCHMVSASSFDKMCADMKAQRDDMTDDLHAHGARELVSNKYAANNLVTDTWTG